MTCLSIFSKREYFLPLFSCVYVLSSASYYSKSVWKGSIPKDDASCKNAFCPSNISKETSRTTRVLHDNQMHKGTT